MRHLVLIGLARGSDHGVPGHRRAPRVGQPCLVRGQRRPRISTSAWSGRRSPRRATRSPRRSRSQGVVAGLDDAFADDVLFLSPRVNAAVGTDRGRHLPHRRPAGAQRAPVERQDRRRVQRRHAGLHLERGIRHLRLRHRRARAAELLPDLLAPRRGGRGLARWPAWSSASAAPRRVGSPPASAPPTPSTAAISPTPRSTAQRAADPERRRGVLGDVGGARQRTRVRAVRRAQRHRVGGGQFIFGPAAIGEAFTSDPTDVISWVPRFSDAAASGDLGFTRRRRHLRLRGGWNLLLQVPDRVAEAGHRGLEVRGGPRQQPPGAGAVSGSER